MATSQSDTIFAMVPVNVPSNVAIFEITVSLNKPAFKAAIIQMETNSQQLLIFKYLRRMNVLN